MQEKELPSGEGATAPSEVSGPVNESPRIMLPIRFGDKCYNSGDESLLLAHPGLTPQTLETLTGRGAVRGCWDGLLETVETVTPELVTPAAETTVNTDATYDAQEVQRLKGVVAVLVDVKRSQEASILAAQEAGQELLEQMATRTHERDLAQQGLEKAVASLEERTRERDDALRTRSDAEEAHATHIAILNDCLDKTAAERDAAVASLNRVITGESDGGGNEETADTSSTEEAATTPPAKPAKGK